MAPCWSIKATVGLFVCGCLIGGHIIDLEIARMFAWIIENKPECMSNYMVYFDGSWSDVLAILSWIGIGFVVTLYVLYLLSLTLQHIKQYIQYFVLALSLYIALLVANSLIAIWYVGTYSNNFWFNSLCDNDEDMSFIYGLLAGSYALPVIGLCCFAWCYIAIT